MLVSQIVMNQGRSCSIGVYSDFQPKRMQVRACLADRDAPGAFSETSAFTPTFSRTGS